MKRTTVLIAAVAAVLLAGCSNGLSAPRLEDPTAPLTTTSSVLSSSSVTSSGSDEASTELSPSSPESSAPSGDEMETAARSEIESAWLGYNEAREGLGSLPEGERSARLEPFAVDPILTSTLENARDWAAQGWVAYGVAEHSVSWEKAVAGSSTAVLTDCADYSKVGAKDAQTGELMTKGGVADLTRVTALRAGGVWKISKVEYYPEEVCTR